MGYIDSENKKYREIAEFDPDSMSAIDNTICYHNAFPGIDIVYEYQDTRLKENIILTPEARENLKSPGDVKIPFQKAWLVFKIQCDFDDSLEVLATNKPLSNRRKMRSGNRIKNVFDNPYEGNEKIRFCNANGQMKYFLTEDIAYVQTADTKSGVSMTHYPLTRRIITEKDENYILTGVPYEWLSSQKAGTIVLDPTVSIQPPTHDTFILDGEDYNFGGESELYLGNPDGTVKFRSLIKFNVDGVIPADTDINSASLMVYYYGYGGGGVMSRTIQCHQVLKNWYEQYATWYHRESSTYWNVAGVGLDNVDAKSTCESSQIFYNTYGWRTFDVKALTQKWLDGTASNYGVLLWATNESISGDMKYIYSSEYSSSSLRPKLVINYTINRNIATYAYDTYSRVSTVTYNNGMTESNSYDSDRSWLTGKTYQKSGVSKYYMSVTGFDAVGNILVLGDSYDFRTFSYDNLNRLKNMTSVMSNSESYSYDNNGNITQLGSTNFSIDGNSNHLANGTYDANGNLKSFNSKTYTYDWRNQLIQQGTSYYVYDAFGQRVRKYESSQYRYYVTSGANVLEEYNHSQSLNAVHIYNGTSRLATIIPGDDIYYICADQIMSSKVLVDETGNKDQTRDYYPYGNTSTSTGSVSAYQFSGKEKDATGLYYFGARYYDPNTMRWLSCDPAEQGWSPYVYCGGNPVNMVDPDGECPILIAMAIGATFNVIMNGQNIENGWDAIGYAAIGALSGAVGAIGTPANWALNTGIGALQGGLAGGLNASLTAKSFDAFGKGFGTGAIAGGISGFVSSEATLNFLHGDGFSNNETLFNQWNDGSISGYNKIIDRFGYTDGVYNPKLMEDPAGVVPDGNGGFKVEYGDNAFSNGYKQFRQVSLKEKFSLDIANQDPSMFPKYSGDDLYYKSEYKAFVKLDRNYGLVHGADRYLGYGKLQNVIIPEFNGFWAPNGYGSPMSYSRPWWDFICTIPRRY